mmetsp:Transcript_10643/g.17068  ORF Transcript_10643/g.17068 Transcript_10643/m.17068 type:complete len:153 (-) Transcript_10643:57-515(-)
MAAWRVDKHRYWREFETDRAFVANKAIASRLPIAHEQVDVQLARRAEAVGGAAPSLGASLRFNVNSSPSTLATVKAMNHAASLCGAGPHIETSRHVTSRIFELPGISASFPPDRTSISNSLFSCQVHFLNSKAMDPRSRTYTLYPKPSTLNH